MSRSRLSSLLLLLVFSFPFLAGLNGAERPLQFNRDIRPILSENCYHCHGPDEPAREADLRLDQEDAAKEWAIVEGDAESSEVVARIFSNDPDMLMPPPDSERSLTGEQKQTLRRWINEGAAYQRHWSFEPPVEPVVPATGSDRVANPIDQFVIRQLQDESIALAPPADRETLLRRITFDLVGLPPTLPEIESFLADTSDHATEKVIDRLLADPRYGERMAADWLDVARYSDTYGYQVDRDRFVWPYRDWVVGAFNQGIGYDDFLRDQVAGDLVTGASRDQILATTFNRLHPQKVEGGSVPEEFRIEYVADRTQTFGTAFLGLTFECCRCHSHKYDPITQTEYYQLSAFFSNIDEAGLYSFFTHSIPTPTLKLPSEQQSVQLDRLRSEVTRLEAEYRQALEPTPDISVFDRLFDVAATGTESAGTPGAGSPDVDAEGGASPQADQAFFATPIESLDFESDAAGPNQTVPGVAGTAVQLTGDDAVNLKSGNFRREQPFSVSLWMKTPDVKQRAVIFHRSRAWTDAASRGYQLLIEDGHLSWSLIHFWPGNAIRIRSVDPIPTDQWVHVAVSNDGSSTAGGLSIFVDGRRVATEVVRDHLDKNITGGGGDHLAIGQRFRDRGFTNGLVDSFRVFDTELTPLEIQRLASSEEQLSWLGEPRSGWTPEQRELVLDHLRHRHGVVAGEKRQQLSAARRRLYQLQDSLQEIMVMRESPGLRKTYRLDRGAYDARAEEVSPGTPTAVGSFDGIERADRLGLVRWMLQKDHPLTSRVAVNRLWQLCFGQGLVRTPEDFGSQGDAPTHPELLDWLAVDLMSHDWDVKRAIKQIMMSATYQASSRHPDTSVYQRDPINRLLARHNAYRLPAEMLRDQALAAAGQLVSTLGGAPVKPYEVEASFKPTKRDSGQGLYRRSLYTYWKRTGPAPAMMTLDASKRDVCRVRRERTSSPLQAFVLLNGPQYVEAARGLAFRLIKRHGDDSDRVLRDAFRTLTSRTPTAEERQVVRELYDNQIAYFQDHPQRGEEYLNVGEMDFRSETTGFDCDPTVFAATSVVVGTLMNYDESVIKR